MRERIVALLEQLLQVAGGGVHDLVQEKRTIAEYYSQSRMPVAVGAQMRKSHLLRLYGRVVRREQGDARTEWPDRFVLCQ
jgi:hypothetical protein